MTSPVTLDPNVHTRVPSSVKTDDNQIMSSLKALAAQIPTLILNEVVAVIKQETGIDLSGAATLIEDLGGGLGFDLNKLSSYFQGIDLSQPGAIVTAIENTVQELVNGIVQKVIDAITGGLNKSGTTGNDPLSIALGFLNPATDIKNIETTVSNVSQDLSALIAGLEGRVTAAEANIKTIAGTATLNSGQDNFNRGSLGSTWTNIIGTLAIAEVYFLFFFPVDGFIRTSAIAAGYLNTSFPATDQHGITVRLTAKSAGTTRVAICSDTAMSNYAAIEIHVGQSGDDFIRIVSGSSPQTVVAHAQANYSGNGLQDNTVVSLKYDPSTNTFRALKDGNDILQWTDDENIVTHGPSKRVCPIVSNADNDPQSVGFGLTDYSYYDWS